MKTSSKLKIIFKSLLIVLLFLGSMVYIAGCQLQKGIEQGYKQGHSKGYEEGFKEGKSKGITQGRYYGFGEGIRATTEEMYKYFYSVCSKHNVFWIPAFSKEGKKIQQRFSCYKTGKDV